MLGTYFTLRKLTGPTARDLGATFERLAELLDEGAEPARVQFRLLGCEPASCWTLSRRQERWEAVAGETERPDFEIITTPETWFQIAGGQLSPLRAFLQGEMRVRGDIDLCKRIFQRVASPGAADAEKGA